VINTNLPRILHRFRDSLRSVQNRYILLPLFGLTPPTEGSPGTISIKFSVDVKDGQGTKCRRKIAEICNRLSRVHERCGRQTTDRRQIDGRATAHSEREREFTFAKNRRTPQTTAGRTTGHWKILTKALYSLHYYATISFPKNLLLIKTYVRCFAASHPVPRCRSAVFRPTQCERRQCFEWVRLQRTRAFAREHARISMSRERPLTARLRISFRQRFVLV